MRLAFVIAIGLTTLTFHPAVADEQMQVLATSGEWAAIEHSESMTAPPDICMLANMRDKVMFRQGEDGLELRVLNNNWSLPSGVSGNIEVAIGSLSKSFPIGDNTATMVTAHVSSDDGQALFTAMDKSSRMMVTIGKAKPIEVSLVGSTRAAVAFKTCAGFKSGESAPGSNPFQ